MAVHLITGDDESLLLTAVSEVVHRLIGDGDRSLMVDEATLPADLTVTARSDDGVVMALRHARLPLEAVQFHPESVLTRDGMRMLENFLGRA